jgi:hypothetical protein
MTDTAKGVIGIAALVGPLLVATYYRGLAITAFRQARDFAPPEGRDPGPLTLAAKVVVFFLSTHARGGPEFFWAPEWLAAVKDPVGRAHVAAFRRYRLLFWLFMAAVPLSFMLVSRLIWT